MSIVTHIEAKKGTLLDREQMLYLKKNLGTHGASDVICRAIDELSLSLAQVEALGQAPDTRAVRKNCRAMKLAANLVGMRQLADVSDEVLQGMEHMDPATLESALGRVVRVGQASLSALWEHPDLPF